MLIDLTEEELNRLARTVNLNCEDGEWNRKSNILVNKFYRALGKFESVRCECPGHPHLDLLDVGPLELQRGRCMECGRTR